MIAPADVLKIKCKFVKDAAAYFNAKKYFLDGTNTSILCIYLQLLQAENEACIDDEDACTLREIARLFKDPACTSVDEYTCEEQLPITLTVNDSYSCNYAAALYNTTGASPLMEFSIANNSEVITGTITSRLTSSCNTTPVDTVFTNQQSYSDRPKGSTRLGVGGTFGGALTAVSIIKTLRVYETDEFGILQPDPIDLDLNPLTSIYYGPSVDFPTLSAVTPSDLQAGSSPAVFEEAFETLMDNVSIVRYGDPGLHELKGTTTNAGNYLYVASAPIHNPSGFLFGINRNDAYILVDTISGDRSTTSVGYLSPSSVINGTANYVLSCGTVTLNIPTISISTPMDFAQTTFNKIVLTSNFASGPISYTSNTLTCLAKELKATYDATNVVSVAWTNSDDDELSTTDTVTVSLSDTYTFTATMNNGCVVSQTITT
jgi:hypothetical protein